MSVNSKMTALADEVRELSGTTSIKSIDAMTSDVAAANESILDQADLISQIKNVVDALPEAGGGSGGSMETCTVTLIGESPALAIWKVYYTDGSSSVQSSRVPEVGQTITITPLKNSVIAITEGFGSVSGDIFCLNIDEYRQVGFFVYGDSTIRFE